MRILGFAFLGIAELAFVAGSCLWFHRRGYYKGLDAGFSNGFAHGHDCGRIDAEKWWMQAEIDVQKAREAIWKAES